ncbi:MAG: phospholipase [Actinomycetota bacterium]|nr:phospholipase [Actinomycetota bacterium]
MCNTATTTEAARAGEAVRPLNQAASGSVALDIGTGRGALVIYPDEIYRDREIEISRVEDDGRRVHTGVHERATQAGSVLAAIFGSLPAGDYLIWADASTPGPVVTVPEAAIAELTLS